MAIQYGVSSPYAPGWFNLGGTLMQIPRADGGNWAANWNGQNTTMPPQQPAPAKTPPIMNQNVQQQMGRLTGQASDALYGGILGYQPKPMTAMGGQSFAAPQGDLQRPFARMQGLLSPMGQYQNPMRMY